MTFFKQCLILLFSSLLLFSCAAITQETAMRQDPLINTIIDTKTSQAIAFEQMVEKVLNADIIYLSEKHDNPAHHAFQEKVILALIEKGKTPLIAFEFFSVEDTPQIMNFIDTQKVKHSADEEAFIETHVRKLLGWDTQSDTMWSYYFSLLKLARKNQLPAAGIDLPSALIRRLSRKGPDQLQPIEKTLITPTGLNNPVYKKYMSDIFKAVHCGMDHGNMQDRLYTAWVARNDKMAHSIHTLARTHSGPVVVIMGNGHTEYGLGVMDRVNALSASHDQVNISMTEITVKTQPLAYYLEPLNLEGFPAVPPADFLYFSQRVSYKDPCEKFKHLKGKKMPRSAGE